MRIKIGINRKAVLAATGQDLGEWSEIEVTKEQMGDKWAAFIAGLDLRTSPPTFIYEKNLTSPDLPAILSALEAHEEEETKTSQAARVTIAQALVELRQKYSNLTTTPAPIAATEKDGQWVSCDPRYLGGLMLSQDGGLEIMFPSFNCYICPDAERDAIIGEFDDKVKLMQDEVAAHNAAEFARLLPLALAAREKAVEEKAKAAAEAEAKRQVEIAESAAKAIETGYWEQETSSYNERRYSSPWCARVSFPNGAKANYSFGEATGKWGKSGLLCIECKPGDIIAWGQRICVSLATAGITSC